MSLRLPSLTMFVSLLLGAAPLACEGGADDSADDSQDSTGTDTGDGDSGDGDGDASTGDGDGDGSTAPGDGDGSTAPGDGDGDGGTGGDAPAQAACQAFEDATPEALIAATTAADAATSAIVPDGSVVYQVTLPEGAAGFIELQIPDWETTQAFFTDVDIDYTVTVESNSQVPGPREPDAACPEAGITDQRVFFPHWTPATIEFSATGPREILLMVMQVS